METKMEEWMERGRKREYKWKKREIEEERNEGSEKWN